jgi:hypothetical protein
LPKFDSTSLPQQSTPVEIQKMGNDLLDKINQTWNQIAAAIAAIPAAPINFAPLPQSGAGVGQEVALNPGVGAALVAPAGGTWRAYILQFVGGGTWSAGPFVVIGAGGSTFEGAVGGAYWIAWAWRILASPDIDFSQPVLLMSDGSYIVTLANGYPYQVLNSPEFSKKWASIRAWLAAGNVAQPYVPPVAPPPDPVATANANLQQIMLKYVNSIMVGPSAPLQFAAQWLAAWKAAGN